MSESTRFVSLDRKTGKGVEGVSLTSPSFLLLSLSLLQIVRSIPQAKVTSYGHVAKLAGYPNYSRHVGQGVYSLEFRGDGS